jgi:hypothetical protein
MRDINHRILEILQKRAELMSFLTTRQTFRV